MFSTGIYISSARNNAVLCANGLTLSQTSPGFYVSAVQVFFFKTLWEKEKLLIKSNFSFSHTVFYLFGEISAIFFKSKIVGGKLFQFGKSLRSVVLERVNRKQCKNFLPLHRV